VIYNLPLFTFFPIICVTLTLDFDGTT